MAFVTLGEALEAALVSMMNDVGDGDVGASPDAGKLPKGVGTFDGPNQVNSNEATQPGKAPASLANGKRLDTASRSPSGVVSRRLALRVIEGGDRRREGTASVAYRAAAGRERAREFLKLVVGGSGH